MKFTFELRYNRIMNNIEPTQTTWKQDVTRLVETLTDPGFQRALEHPQFKDAFAKVVFNNHESIVTEDSCDIMTMVEILTEFNISFFVKEGDDRLFVSDNDGDSVWKDGKFVEVDDDGIEMG